MRIEPIVNSFRLSVTPPTPPAARGQARPSLGRCRFTPLVAWSAIIIFFGSLYRSPAQGQPARSADDNWSSQFDYSGLSSDYGNQNGALALAYVGTNLYVGGYFSAAGQTLANSIAQWDGSRWHALGAGLLGGAGSVGGGYGSGTPVLGAVWAIAVSGSKLYVGGTFQTAGDQYANGVARWDGASWRALGDGILNGVQDKNGLGASVYSLLVVGNDLYVGGNFAQAGGIASPGVAKWNGTNWSSIGGGIPNVTSVRALAWDGQKLYVGGQFQIVGSQSVAAWDGTKWLPMALGLSSTGQSTYALAEVRSLAVLGTKVYAAGYFNLADSVVLAGNAMWDGATWSPAVTSLTGGERFRLLYTPDGQVVQDFGVGALATVSNVLYAAGSFTTTNGSPAVGLAALTDATQWSVQASGLGSVSYGGAGSVPSGVCPALASDGQRFVIGGWFTQIDSANAAGIAQRSGKTLIPLNDGGGFGVVEGTYPAALASDGTNLLVGFVGNSLARWDGAGWSSLGAGVSRVIVGQPTIYPGIVRALAPNNGVLYVGGTFSAAGDQYANAVAEWNGTNWALLGAGVNNGVSASGNRIGNISSGWGGDYPVVAAIAVDHTNVYVGGFFDRAGGAPAAAVARWDGTNWSSLGNGLQGNVFAMAVGPDGLYVGGEFSYTDAGGVTRVQLGRWDGASWSSPGGGFSGGGYSQVNAIQVHQGEVYVAGDFNGVGGVSAAGVAKWDGATWVGFPGKVYASGDDSWSMNGATSLAFDGDDLYVMAEFTLPVAPFYRNPRVGVAKWTSAGWVMLGKGFSYLPYYTLVPHLSAITVIGKSLYAAGDFALAGNAVSFGLARYNLALDFTSPALSALQALPGGAVTLSATNVNAASAFLDATTDFSQWSRVATNAVTGGTVTFKDSTAANFSRRFYRVALP